MTCWWTRRAALVAALSLSAPAEAIDVATSGAWSITVDATDLVSGAGSDLVASYESASSEVTIDLTNTADSGDAWRVDVKMTGSWHADLHLWVRRTGGGSGPGTISGGTTYQEITSTYAASFSGTGDRTGVPLQFKVTGVSVGVDPTAHLRVVVYQVVDT